MYLLPSSEQSEIISVINDFLANEISVRRYQDESLLGRAYSNELWEQLVGMGWFGISQSEANGGSGLGLVDEAFLAREAGRQVVSPSVLATTMGVHIAAATGNDELIAQFIGGEKRVALALSDNLVVTGDSVSGDLKIFDGENVDCIFVCNREQAVLLDAAVVAEPQLDVCTDESVRLELATIQQVATLAASSDQAFINNYALLLAGNLVGIAEAARDNAAAYAKEREQFGQAIGSFQSINHMCADMAVAAEAAWAQLAYAALAVSDQPDVAEQSIASVVLLSQKAALSNARHNVQIHGGVGFTVEYDAHFYVKRSHVYRQLLDACFETSSRLLAAS